LQILFAAKMHKELDADRLACPHLVHVRLRERYAPSNAIVAEKLDSPAVLEIWGQLIKRHERVQEASPDTAQHEPRLHSEGLERRGLFCELRGQPVVHHLVRAVLCLGPLALRKHVGNVMVCQQRTLFHVLTRHVEPIQRHHCAE
jgi:hypothetical protein